MHFDATGTVVKDLPHNKRVLYYTLIPADQNVPVCDFLSSQQTAETISYLLQLFIRDARICNNSVTLQPRYIVTDFSYALIIACLQSFNLCSLSRYLHIAMHILSAVDNNITDINERTHICLCIAHVIKNFTRTVSRSAPKVVDKRKRQ